MYGGADNDTYYVAWNGGSGDKAVDDSGGTDIIRFTGSAQGVDFDLALTSWQAITLNFRVKITTADTIENLMGSSHADGLYGTTGANDIDAQGLVLDLTRSMACAGNDYLWMSSPGGYLKAFGGDGDDTITGDCGNDEFYGEDGNDLLIGGGDGNDSLSGGAGDDWMYGGFDDDELIGGSGTDHGYGGDDSSGGYGDDSDINLGGIEYWDPDGPNSP